ncbi:SDR family NAD(P)-dependent oxidoreductase [Sinorhizobium prairiense]|uniref:SDR family NAD(P)-dependent oxidoreductase n=1 Tax=unclassified Sinorhizobium TaxID=2613772 RepID=UPI0023D81A6A|nr:MULTISPECIES: SDR family NAD(P)-dependent oxidoreductase [unclassified Sinorhizobium]WEJ08747.1 SDR family NAD(P)-dependent oxidoreductase [Sinorhizobium sp. M103]WEJ13753.1 SDR family NAD(P)-dependent oxidoreductase [Sinorhizobium sp. K101]WEJ35350.1 SDR family NAD(P)-dependent oxidoreductase [Sinorhizobium sp. C101]
MNHTANKIIAPGRVAVITGAAKGLGAAMARRLAAERMRLALFDSDEDALKAFASSLSVDHMVVVGDVSNPSDLQRLRDETRDRLEDVALLVNNAGITKGAGPWDDPALWRRQLEVNFFAVVTAQHLFVPGMIEQSLPSAVVNLGSKEGITTPPGNAAYSVSKAGIKVLTEQLSHELRKATNGRVSAHLLVPGYTWTPMNFPGSDFAPGSKPEEPWTAEQVIELFLERFRNGDFYIICPDNAVTPALDAKRIRWAAEDMVRNRPALSRWHPDHKEEFARWLAE